MINKIKERITKSFLKTCNKLRIKEAEIYFEETEKTLISMLKGELKEVFTTKEMGVGIRVIIAGAEGYYSTCGLRSHDIEFALKKAIDIAKWNSNDIGHILTEGKNIETGAMLPIETNFSKKTIKDKIRFVQETNKFISSNLNTSFDYILSNYSDISKYVYICNTKGLSKKYKNGYCILSIDGNYHIDGEKKRVGAFSFSNSLIKLNKVKLCEEVNKKLSPRNKLTSLNSLVCPVVFDPFTTAYFVSVLGFALSAETLYKGSFLRPFIEKNVGNERINIIDDGTNREGFNAFPFDSEGTKRQKTVLIENGILKTVLSDNYWGNKFNKKSTGNAFRKDYMNMLCIIPNNLILEGGNTEVIDIIKNVNYGLYVDEIIGANIGMNIYNGDISLGIKGRLIEEGNLTCFVTNTMISTNFIDLLNNIIEIGNDYKWVPIPSVYSPSILVDNITIVGRRPEVKRR